MRGMAQLNISMPSDLQRWVDQRIAAGRYTDAADYLRDLVRRDQDDHVAQVRWVQELVDEGLASGVIDAEPEKVLREVMAGVPTMSG